MAPRLIFDIFVDIEEQQYTLDDKPYWKKLSTLELGPHRHVASSDTFIVSRDINKFCNSTRTLETVKLDDLLTYTDHFPPDQVKAEYIGDFHPDTFSRTKLLLSKYIIIPDLDDIQRKLGKSPDLAKELCDRKEIHFMKKSSEWLAVDQNMVALNDGGNTCDRMGVTYSDFRWQSDFCTNKEHRYIWSTPD